jgi:hypothetical protein
MAMETARPQESRLCGATASLLRMELSAYRELSRPGQRAGRVGRIYQSGFDLVMESGRWLHFHNGDCLVSPFSALLDGPVPLFLARASLRSGDAMGKRDGLLFLEGQGCGRIDTGGVETPDLRAPARRRATVGDIGGWLALLAGTVCAEGRFEGLGGALALLEAKGLAGGAIRLRDGLNCWSEHAASVLNATLGGLGRGEPESLEALWTGLLGVGPGLTTAGDDFLVGFLSAHRFLDSPLAPLLEQPRMKGELRRLARARTNDVGVQFLDCAVEGLFSEMIHRLFAGLFEQAGESATRRCVGDCLSWGHSSGTDAMTGLLFGLWTLMNGEGKRDGLDSQIRH